MLKKWLYKLFVLLIFITVTGCAPNVSSNTYEASEVGVASKVVPGVILAKRNVKIDANSKMGGLAGVAAGAAAGSGVGGSTAGNVVGAVGGAVIGGVAANAIDKAVNSHEGYEYVIKLNSGNIVSIVQTKNVELSVKQHVLVLYGSMTRIIPDNIAHSHV